MSTKTKAAPDFVALTKRLQGCRDMSDATLDGILAERGVCRSRQVTLSPWNDADLFARTVCARCTVRTECLTVALRIDASHNGSTQGLKAAGVWGGLDECERRNLIRHMLAAPKGQAPRRGQRRVDNGPLIADAVEWPGVSAAGRFCGKRTRWANPWGVEQLGTGWAAVNSTATECRGPVRDTIVEARKDTLRFFADHIQMWADQMLTALADVSVLTCWCPLGTPCHVDVIIAEGSRRGIWGCTA